MQVSSNLNSMIQLEKKLEESTKELAKLNTSSNEKNNDNRKQLSSQNNVDENNLKNTDLVKEIVQQIEIPIAYNANAEVISTQNSVSKTLLDIKA